MTTTNDNDTRLARARDALEGLSVGDGFGEKFFRSDALDVIQARRLPNASWYWTDDTAMALSIVAVLRQHNEIEQDALAQSFATEYARDRSRGYGPGMHRLLPRIFDGAHWRTATAALFEGQGSYGNGAAMRVAPLGAFFADDLAACVAQAARSAEVTHAHSEGVAGAVAVAVAAAWAVRLRGADPLPTRAEFIELVLHHTPRDTEVYSRACRARDLAADATVATAVGVLGSGLQISAQDTVPFVLWCAGTHLARYEEALWLTAAGLGDVDTTCAMVGGIVGAHVGSAAIPADWRARREALPSWPFDV